MFYGPIIEKKLKTVSARESLPEQEIEEKEEEMFVFIEYLGTVSDQFK